MALDLDAKSASLAPLPEIVTNGLRAIVVLSTVSLISTSLLFFALGRTLFFKWRRKSHGVQIQFLFLIFNLLLADIQQAVAFFINIEWLVRNEINVDSQSCFAQGWFVSVGDLASGVWALAIGLHTFACIALSYRISAYTFYSLCAFLWAFVFLAAILGVALHPQDIYVRAGAWVRPLHFHSITANRPSKCWINTKYPQLRLWAHYIWIFLAEFGTVFVYATLFYTIRRRIKQNHFNPTKAAQAQQAAYMMITYPAIYIVCTLPLASARLSSIVGNEPGSAFMCLAGAMITSNGWLDVLVFCLTRNVFIFSDELPRDDSSSQAEADIIDTFTGPFPFWKGRQHFGTTTTIEAGRNGGARTRLSRQSSTEPLFDGLGPLSALAVKTETTVVVRSDPMELNDISGISHAKNRMSAASKERTSFDTEASSKPA